ncbi:adenylate/guanylate cyclase domain-containing protein [Paenibacillus radicis (ex Xue et al. 2023)]|uniref:HAMP domain-containing protein n=1 Tax=Paenibacillus radicis (ex Xue et al. 2023) TaxID=2972489 RepID=A0ABT1YM40_9BACL|nr:adenylate/guanylate cyclase domain-containing protein [Paenibacillus radicis (ex Xue et al. 2023)]MCR8633800.1 HAMP domain-containing protein [Paenibacillus radicis (ex Xue et al. 2023)]
MKKYIAVLLLVLILAAGAGYYVYLNKGTLTSSPFRKDLPFGSVSNALVDEENNLYVIDNSKKSIVKLNSSGNVIYTVSTNDTGGEIYHFNELAADKQGNLYTVKTTLDSYGLTVRSEQIIRLTPEGQQDQAFFRKDYSESERKRYRIGSLKSLKVQGDVLSFFVDDFNETILYQAAAGSTEPRAVFTAKLPEGKYLAGVAGTTVGQIYVSARSGEIYRMQEGGRYELIYPLPGIDRSYRNFPEKLNLDRKGRLLYIDYYGETISRIDPANPYIVEALLTKETAKQQGMEISSDVMPTIALGADDSLLEVHEGMILHQSPDGTIIGKITGGTYSTEAMGHKWFVWALAVVGLLLFAFAVKLLYFNIMNRRISLMLKQIIVFVPVIVASMVLLSYFIYTNFSQKLEDETIHELSLLARNGRNLIDGDKLEKMSSPLEYMSSDYKSFRQKMDSVFEGSDESGNRGFYKALYKYEDGVIYRIIEDADDVNMFNPFPQTEKNQEVVKQGKIATDQWQDETGFWIYALGPIYNSSGKIVGLFETSKNMEGILQHRRELLRNIIQNIAVITLILLCIFMLMTYLMLSSIRKLRSSAIAISQGNWDTVVDIRTRDEVSDLGDSFNMMAEHIRGYIAKVTRVSEAYYRFVPQQFLKYLDKDSILEVRLGDQVEQEMSILIVNIRSFYLLSKKLTPEENFNFINSFLNRFGPYVRNHDGLINKYAGAGFMALFPNAVEQALLSCIGMRKELDLYNVHRAHSGYRPIDIGIGLHKGPLRLGIIGEEQRLEGNVISDDVNLANELERLTEPLGASILVSDFIIQSLSDRSIFQYRSLGLIRVEGKEEPLQVFDVYHGESDTARALKEKTKALFEQAVVLYQVGRFYDAREAFVQVIKINRQDKAAKLYFYLCDEYFQNGTTEEWNGTLSVS